MTMDARRDYGVGNPALAYSLVSPVPAMAMTAKEFVVDLWQFWDKMEADIPEIERQVSRILYIIRDT